MKPYPYSYYIMSLQMSTTLRYIYFAVRYLNTMGRALTQLLTTYCPQSNKVYMGHCNHNLTNWSKYNKKSIIHKIPSTFH